MTTTDPLKFITEIAAASLAISGVVAMLHKAIKWIGAGMSKFVKEQVVPPIEKLTHSVDDLSKRTHENTITMSNGFAEQQRINTSTAVQLAEVRGHLGLNHEEHNQH